MSVTGELDRPRDLERPGQSPDERKIISCRDARNRKDEDGGETRQRVLARAEPQPGAGPIVPHAECGQGVAVPSTRALMRPFSTRGAS